MKRLEVEVLRAQLGDFGDLGAYERVLTPEETARANGYKLPEPRRVFILARGLLRLELGRRMRCQPGEIQFDLRPSGKPDVRRTGTDRPDWRFSVSHTGPHAAIAFCRGTDVGLDIERLDRTVEPLAIAKRYFTPAELAALKSWPDAQRPRAFLAGWTRKEAIVKARGVTMAESLTTLSVGLDPDDLHPSHEDARGSPARAACRLTTFEFAALKLIGAVALVSPLPPRLRFRVVNGAAFD